MRWLIASAAAIAVIAAVYCIAGGPKANAQALLPPPTEVIPFESHEWVERLRSGADVEFVREAVGSLGEPEIISHVKGLGPLPSGQIEKLLMHVGVEASAMAYSTALEKAESGDPEDYIDFLKERYCFEKVKAAANKARHGDYVTTEMGSQLPPMPSDFVRLGQLGAGFIGGKRVDVWFLFDLSVPKNIELREMKAVWEEAEALHADEDAAAFNLLDIATRRNLIDQHFAAALAVQGESQLPRERRKELRGQMLPNKFMIDREYYTVRRRIIRRF